MVEKNTEDIIQHKSIASQSTASKMPIQLNQHLSETVSTNTEQYNIHDGWIYYRAVVLHQFK